MEKFEIEYFLIDDGGASSIFIPIILEIGTKFTSEYGKDYIVSQYDFEGKQLNCVMCENIELIKNK